MDFGFGIGSPSSSWIPIYQLVYYCQMQLMNLQLIPSEKLEQLKLLNSRGARCRLLNPCSKLSNSQIFRKGRCFTCQAATECYGTTSRRTAMAVASSCLLLWPSGGCLTLQVA